VTIDTPRPIHLWENFSFKERCTFQWLWNGALSCWHQAFSFHSECGSKRIGKLLRKNCK